MHVGSVSTLISFSLYVCACGIVKEIYVLYHIWWQSNLLTFLLSLLPLYVCVCYYLFSNDNCRSLGRMLFMCIPNTLPTTHSQQNFQKVHKYFTLLLLPFWNRKYYGCCIWCCCCCCKCLCQRHAFLMIIFIRKLFLSLSYCGLLKRVYFIFLFYEKSHITSDF